MTEARDRDEELEELLLLVGHEEARIFSGLEDLARETLVFFEDIPDDLLERREALLMSGRGGPEWYLVTEGQIGTEQEKELRAQGVLLVEVDDAAAARERLERAAQQRPEARRLSSISKLRAALGVARSPAEGLESALTWEAGGPVPDELGVVGHCFGSPAGPR